MILATRFTFIVEKSWKKNIHFLSKWLDHLLLITSYLVTIETDHHWTCLKMRARDKRTSTENVRCWCFILLEKSQKNLKGGGVFSTPHPLYVRGLKCYFFEKGKLWQRTCLLEPKHKRDRCAACHPLQFFTKNNWSIQKARVHWLINYFLLCPVVYRETKFAFTIKALVILSVLIIFIWQTMVK